MLSQLRVDAKTNEHKAALELLKTLVLNGRVAVGDALFCQRDLCQQMLAAGGDYLVAVKENQPGLWREIDLEFAAIIGGPMLAGPVPLPPAPTVL